MGRTALLFLLLFVAVESVRRPNIDARRRGALKEPKRLKRQISTGVGGYQVPNSQFDPQFNQFSDYNTFGMNHKTSYQSWQACQKEWNCDPRSLEDWWMLYPYGRNARALDAELLNLINRETQINLGFDCPYYGFRFNYTQVWPNGFISFAMPPPIMPPYDFPNPRWPNERDHSFIAPFYAEAAFQYVGNTKISNVWHRTVHRPRVENPSWLTSYTDEQVPGYGYQESQDIGYRNYPGPGPNQVPFDMGTGGFRPGGGGIVRRKRQIPALNQTGDVIDTRLLDQISHDIQAGYNGAQGWRAEHALIVTWERIAYGGARKHVDVHTFEHVLQWQNTFQLVLASDQIRTFAMFNYARLNWTTSNAAGGLNGYGGFQPAMVGFNGGNGTGWTPLPRSGEGRVWKLAHYSNVLTPGRWIYRVDEEIIPGGCSNASVGFTVMSPPYGVMVGGIAVNISGPCLRPGDMVRVVFDEWPVDCIKVNRFRARCVMPPFKKTGLMNVRMSRDGGQSYPYVGWFYVLPPERAPPKVYLHDDVESKINKWYTPQAEELLLTWEWRNLTSNKRTSYDVTDVSNLNVDISLWGYYEDAFRSYFEKVDTLGTTNNRQGSFVYRPQNPGTSRKPLIPDAWKKFHFGMVQVAITDDTESGVLWSRPTPFSWYYLKQWQHVHGDNWATDMCIDWFEYDGRRRNFIMDLEPCPCKLEQALLDLGRFMPLFDCDKDGNGECKHHKGALHCVQSVQSSWTGSGQQCCYNYEGYLMFSDDWEPIGDYTRYYQPGVPARGHAFGSPPFTRQPPRIPTFSNYNNDLMPYYMCCRYADHCEFYYWRRQSHGCQSYSPPGAAYIYGEPHVRTFDGIEYAFQGKGYFILAMNEDPRHRLMVQGRFEQPDKTLWRTEVNATVLTGVAVRENGSDIVQVFARKPHRRWRYKTDVYVNGIRVFFDKPHWKYQQFTGVSIRNPQLNMNQSELVIMLDSGAAIRVMESFGMLDVMVALPSSFNSSCNKNNLYNGQEMTNRLSTYERPCYITRGLLGAWDGDPQNDLMNLNGQSTGAPGDKNGYNEATLRSIYQYFTADKSGWRVDPTNPRIGQVLFQDRHQPIYNPLLFAQQSRYEFQPIFFVNQVPYNASMIFDREQVRAVCMGQPQCEYDYFMTGRREVAIETLQKRNKFIELQREGSQYLISCGPLQRQAGVIKTPPAKNYLSGDVVQFSCKAGYWIHGTAERICRNGTWSPGWWVWCRDRDLEYGLKWLTGVLVAVLVIAVIVGIFVGLWRRNKRVREQRQQTVTRVYKPEEPPRYQAEKPKMPLHLKDDTDYSDSFDREPARLGYKPVPRFEETSA